MIFRLSLYFLPVRIIRYGRISSPSTCTHLIPEDGVPPKIVVLNSVLCLVCHSVCWNLDELQPAVFRNSKPQWQTIGPLSRIVTSLITTR